MIPPSARRQSMPFPPRAALLHEADYDKSRDIPNYEFGDGEKAARTSSNDICAFLAIHCHLVKEGE
jgi:hypothetical protein